MVSNKSRPTVTISDGQLQGVSAITNSKTPYYAFRGIPFAKPPVGDLRFMPPQPVDPWDGVRDASYERSICCQPNLLQPSSLPLSLTEMFGMLFKLPTLYRILRTFWDQSEDCLYLNVFTPKLPSSDSETVGLPVLVYIHGGAFLVGSGSEVFSKQDKMIDRGILVVTINYRLGPFGFLSLETDSAPGNAGMKDQVQALRWVQHNISKFGGDPNRVTIFGESAGAMAVHFHTVSPLAKGLFHGAIGSSGVGSLNFLQKDPAKNAKELAKYLNIQASTNEDLALALKRVTSSELLKAFAKYDVAREQKTLTCMVAFTPTVERPGPSAFLSEHPDATMRDGRQAQVPYMTGVSANEGLVWYMFHPDANIMPFANQRQKLMPLELYEALSEEERREVGDKIVDFYFGDKGICKDTEAQFIILAGDIIFAVDLLSTCRQYAVTSRAPVYMYRVSFDGKLSGSEIILRNRPGKGPGHCGEMPYILDMAVIDLICPPLSPKDRDEIIFSQRLCGVFASFIKTGKPTIPDDVNAEGTVWTPVTATSLHYLDLGSKYKMQDDNLGNRFQFWANLYEKYLKKQILVPK